MSDHHWADESDLYRAVIVDEYGDASALEYLAARSPVDGGGRR